MPRRFRVLPPPQGFSQAFGAPSKAEAPCRKSLPRETPFPHPAANHGLHMNYYSYNNPFI